MPRKRYSAEEIVNKLQQAEVELAKSRTVAQVCKQLAVTDQTYYRWRREYAGMKLALLEAARHTLDPGEN